MSTNRRIYLDFNATAPLSAVARDAMVAAMSEVGNPSSIHAEGRRIRDRVERARNQIAALVGRPREQIVFTSGGTEANWLGVMGLAAAAEARGLPRIVATTKLEHPSLRAPVAALGARGWTIVDVDAMPDEAGLIAVALVNHELGSIVHVDVSRARARARSALVHLDAVQAAGKLDLTALDADSIAISAHKIGGPQGVGALAITVDDGLPVGGADGGHQERGRRAGTENTLGIVGFGAAAASADPSTWSHVAALGEQLERGLLAIEGTRIHGAGRARVGGTINAGFAGALGESIVMALDLEGIAVATGAACTSGSVQPSPVLLGLGLSADEARSAVRFSLGRTTSEVEIGETLRVLPRVVERARRNR
ncbi:MAG: cysteine desulfurase [Kofleriaceae bacterium]|nr:cysteine desulfurase [Kofleriaceae bacterium]